MNFVKMMTLFGLFLGSLKAMDQQTPEVKKPILRKTNRTNVIDPHFKGLPDVEEEKTATKEKPWKAEKEQLEETNFEVVIESSDIDTLTNENLKNMTEELNKREFEKKLNKAFQRRQAAEREFIKRFTIVSRLKFSLEIDEQQSEFTSREGPRLERGGQNNKEVKAYKKGLHGDQNMNENGNIGQSGRPDDLNGLNDDINEGGDLF